MDLLPEEYRRKSIREIITEYRGEACLGDCLELHSRLEKESLWLFGQTDRPVFRMKLGFS